MALKQIVMENFRGKAKANYRFSPSLNRITGRNGSGKSTIKEAIVFGFCGTDSLGTRNPQHLISSGEEGCRITLQTDKAEIVRTLNRKGGSTIKLTREGVGTTLTQSQLEQMMGSSDLFLSIFLPGHFFGLSTDRQQRVIAEVMPKVDRKELFEKIVGFRLTNEELSLYPFDKRAELLASYAAKDRRDLERGVAILQGQIKELESLKPLPFPEAKDEEIVLSRLEILKGQWKEYLSQRNVSETVRRHRDNIVLENQMRAQKRSELKAEIDSLHIVARPEYEPLDLASLLAKKKPLPEAPSLAQTVETDHCPTCGQTVGMKHKERVRKKNEEILSAYHDELAKVSAYNASVQEEIHQAQLEHDRKKADYLRTVEENNRTVAVKQRLELQLASLKDVEVPQIADIPNPPEENFDEAKYKEVKLAVDKLKSARAQYDYVQKRIAESKVNIEGLQQQIESNLQLISRLEKIEGGLRLLPSEELKLQSSVFEMEDIKVYIDDEIHVLVGGLPYGLLSTGQQMKVALQISSKINEVSRRPLNMFFVDNADLVDELRKTNGQVFLAEVDSSDLTIRGEV